MLCYVLMTPGDTEDPALLSPEAKAGLMVVDELGGTALTTAIRGNHSSIAALLLNLGANPNDVYISNEVYFVGLKSAVFTSCLTYEY